MSDSTDNRLRLLVERIERLREEAKGIAEDIKDVFAEAKAVGYDTKVLRAVIARRAVPPADRAEADMVLATYEAALGGGGEDPAISPDEASRELAIAILAEQAEGIQDPERAAALADHVAVLLDIRAEIAQLRTAENNRKTLAVNEGFEKSPLSALIRWIEKCVKHGPDAMRAGEAIFQMYRGSIEGRGIAPGAPVSSDPKLQKTFGGKTTAKDARTQAWLQSGLGD